jgi:HEAT repeat protein
VSEDLASRLRSLLADPVPEVRREAARALSVIDATDVASLAAALDDANDGVRRAATLALGRIRDPRATDALVQALRDRPELWQETSAALATAGDRDVVSRIVPLLESPSSHVRCGALRAIAALSKHPHPRAEQEPLFFYRDDEGHSHPLF